MSWIYDQLFKFIEAPSLNAERLSDAFIKRDLNYLIRAYKYGASYLRLQVVEYISRLESQEALEFLIGELEWMDKNQTSHDSNTVQVFAWSVSMLKKNPSLKISEEQNELLKKKAHLAKEFNDPTGLFAGGFKGQNSNVATKRNLDNTGSILADGGKVASKVINHPLPNRSLPSTRKSK